MRLLPPESPELGRLLRHLRDEDHLWTPFGLRYAMQTGVTCIPFMSLGHLGLVYVRCFRDRMMALTSISQAL